MGEGAGGSGQEKINQKTKTHMYMHGYRQCAKGLQWGRGLVVRGKGDSGMGDMCNIVNKKKALKRVYKWNFFLGN